MTDAEILSLIQSDATASSLAKSGDDAGCAARLMAIVPLNEMGPITQDQLLIWAASTGAIDRVVAAQSDAKVGAACKAIMIRVNSGGSLDAGNKANQAMIGGLVAAGVLTSDEATSLASMGLRKPTITANDVSRVLSPTRPDGKI